MIAKAIVAVLLVVTTIAGCGAGKASTAQRRAEVVRCLRAAGWTVSAADQTRTLIVVSSGKAELTIYPRNGEPVSDWKTAWTSYTPPNVSDAKTYRRCLG